MSAARRVTIGALLLLALAGLAVDAAAFQLTAPPRVGPYKAGNDGVGGIEWHPPGTHLPGPKPQHPWTQGEHGQPVPPPANARSNPASPLEAGALPRRSTVVARSLPAGPAAPTLEPLADASSGALAGLRVGGLAPGARAWLVAGTSVVDLPLAGGRLLPRPQLLLPLGRVDGSGELLRVLPELAAAEGLVLQVWVQGPGWTASDALLVVDPRP